MLLENELMLRTQKHQLFSFQKSLSTDTECFLLLEFIHLVSFPYLIYCWNEVPILLKLAEAWLMSAAQVAQQSSRWCS